MPDGLYERDALAWSEQQADLLRRLERGERVNAEIDWPNLIEEVADVGLSELRACRSLLRQAMVHLMKLHYRSHGPTTHWTAEVIVFLADARDGFSPSMHQHLDLVAIYGRARREATVRLQRRPEELPASCPWSLDELLAPEPDVAALAAKLPPA